MYMYIFGSPPDSMGGLTDGPRASRANLHCHYVGLIVSDCGQMIFIMFQSFHQMLSDDLVECALVRHTFTRHAETAVNELDRTSA